MKLRFWEQFKGFVQKSSTGKKKHTYPHELSWAKRCDFFDKLAEKHGLAKSQCMTIAGQCTANGLFLKPSKENARSKEAISKLEDLNKQIHIRSLVFKTAKNMAQRGSFFWEKTWTPTFNVRSLPLQKWMEPAVIDSVLGVTRWRQAITYRDNPEWSSEDIVHFAWDVTDLSWPYGTSLLAGLDTEFETLGQLETDIKEYVHKTAAPKEVVSVYDKDFMGNEDDVSSVRSQFRNWSPGEQIVTNYPVNYTAGGVGDRKFESLDTTLGFLKEQIVDGTMVPPISKQYNATEASAKEMMPFFHANIIEPMQEIIAEKLADEVYKPYLESLGYSVKLCPEIEWEPPDADREETAKYYSDLVAAQIMPPEVAADALGFGDEYREWRLKEDKREMERMQAQKVMGGPSLPKQAQGGTVAAREQVRHKHTYVIDKYE